MNAIETIKKAMIISIEKFEGDQAYHAKNINNAIGNFAELKGWNTAEQVYGGFVALCQEELPKCPKPLGYISKDGSEAENIANYVNWFAADKIKQLKNS